MVAGARCVFPDNHSDTSQSSVFVGSCILRTVSSVFLPVTHQKMCLASCASKDMSHWYDTGELVGGLGTAEDKTCEEMSKILCVCSF